MPRKPKPKVVPLHQSAVPVTPTPKCEARTVHLPGDRHLTVGLTPEGHRLVVIRRPAPDGNIAELDFGLSEEAAFALRQLLNESFERQPASDALITLLTKEAGCEPNGG